MVNENDMIALAQAIVEQNKTLAMMLEQQQLQSEILSLLSARIVLLRDRINEIQFRVENGY